jgi:hypothetical protein
MWKASNRPAIIRMKKCQITPVLDLQVGGGQVIVKPVLLQCGCQKEKSN